MDYRQFYEKAEEMLVKIDELPKQNISKGCAKYYGIEELIRNSRHLIYAFDNNLPLNQEIDRYYNVEDIGDFEVEKIKRIIKFFTVYIFDYYLT